MYRMIRIVGILFFLLILWGIYLANIDDNNKLFDFIAATSHADKVVHFGIFFSLTLVAVVGSKFKSFGVMKLNVYYGMAAVTLFVITEEVSQAFIPSRSFEFLDLAADGAGIAFATLAAYFLNKRLLKRDNKARS